MGNTEKALAILREVGILSCMMLFVVSGALLMLRYANDGDFLPILAGFVAMGVGAVIVLKTPARVRAYSAADFDENEAYDEALVAVRPR